MIVPLKDIFKNKLLLQENFHTQEISMDEWPFWMFEEKIKIANEIIEEKEKNRKKQEEGQKQQMPNMNPSQYTSSMNNLMNKFKR
jgi:hypothetical protein